MTTTAECREFEELLVDMLDGRLAAGPELRMHAHAESCPSCAASLSRWDRGLPALRELAPTPPSPMALRRMELAVASAMRVAPAIGSARRPALAWLRLRWAVPGALAACALVLLASRLIAPSPTAFGRLATSSGLALVDGKPPQPGAQLHPGSSLAMTSPGQLAFDLGRNAQARLAGPGRATLLGDARAVRVRLESGELALVLGKRQSGESFSVETRHGRVEVRGTRFSVGFAGQGSWVRVDEGLVAAFRIEDPQPHSVGAGQTFWLAPESPALAPAPASIPGEKPGEVVTDTQPTPASDCITATARARRAMRAGQPGRALRLLDDQGSLHETQASQRCRDEIGYLRAEALRASGRLREAISAYLRLDRRGAEPAMRQNALFAAGELEERVGRHAAAYQRFEAATAVAPSGGLRQEAMERAMQAALAAREKTLARAAAQRYLREFPSGGAVPAAQRILHETTGERTR